MPAAETVEFHVDIPIAKTDEDKRIFFGWANVAIGKDGQTVVDNEGDFIDAIDELETAAYEYVMKSRDLGERHIIKGRGQLVESFVVTPEKLEKMGLAPDALPLGWWTGFYVEDDSVWKAVKDGEYTMLSVHGTGRREAA